MASEPDNTPDIRIEVPEGEAHPPGWRDRTDEVASMLWLGVALGWFAGLATGGVLSPAGVAAARGVNKSTVLGWLREYGYRYDRASKQWVRRS